MCVVHIIMCAVYTDVTLLVRLCYVYLVICKLLKFLEALSCK